MEERWTRRITARTPSPYPATRKRAEGGRERGTAGSCDFRDPRPGRWSSLLCGEPPTFGPTFTQTCPQRMLPLLLPSYSKHPTFRIQNGGGGLGSAVREGRVGWLQEWCLLLQGVPSLLWNRGGNPFCPLAARSRQSPAPHPVGGTPPSPPQPEAPGPTVCRPLRVLVLRIRPTGGVNRHRQTPAHWGETLLGLPDRDPQENREEGGRRWMGR